MTILQNRLALHRFVCHEFGYLGGMSDMLDFLHDLPAGFDAAGESEYVQALLLHRHRDRAKVTPEQLTEYDANIAALSRGLRMTGEHGRAWKPHQYLALLFTEHYLNRYFADPETPSCRSQRGEAPGFADQSCCRTTHRTTFAPSLSRARPAPERRSSCTLTSSSTAIGLRQAGGKRLNNVILLTPNEQMSAQHERELRESGLHARIFSSDAGPDLFPHGRAHRSQQAGGEERASSASRCGTSVRTTWCSVDEGHLGASGNVWRERRAELARGGFAFEYSATFNQIAGRDETLRDAYGKCLLFDYSYRWFHEDGYGKDYAIANLPAGIQDENSDLYLLGCLLTFYQQCRIWRDKGTRWTAFNVAKPLWVFLGKTVTGNRSRADEATKSDVVVILDFLGRVLADDRATRAMLDRLLAGRSGLSDDAGEDWFAGRFRYLVNDRTNRPDDLYADICETLFHGSGRLHVVYLTAGEGELHLRVADGPVFGVVNVGDSAALYRMLSGSDHPDLEIERELGFAERLFATVDRPDSTVNVVIGARRFIAGWNSWRVSTMGLMHVGVGEGPEVIQTFGRGVRLKGWNMSLKRHSRTEAPAPRRPRRPRGAGAAVRLRAPVQLHADLSRLAGEGRNPHRTRDDPAPRHLELRAEDGPQDGPAGGGSKVRAVR